MDSKKKRELILDNYQNPSNRGIPEDSSYKRENSKNESCVDNIDIAVKIDNNILKDIKDGKNGSFANLLTYAKSANSIYSGTLDGTRPDSSFVAGGIITDDVLFTKSQLTNNAYYYLYAVLEDENGKCNEVIVDMGEPIFQDKNIPYSVYEPFNKDLDIDVNEEKMRFTVVSMGNPHAITFVENIDDLNIEKYGPIIEKNPIFPNKTNVEFVEIIDKNNIKVRVWERGVGETFACGTGACAAVVASGLNGYTGENVTVDLPGGKLQIEWGKDNHIYMQGTATKVFDGTINEDE